MSYCMKGSNVETNGLPTSSGSASFEARAMPAASAPDSDMRWIPGGTFRMGSEEFYPEERPVRKVSVDGFWMDRCVVTNSQFAHFVAATGYVTLAERPLSARRPRRQEVHVGR